MTASSSQSALSQLGHRRRVWAALGCGAGIGAALAATLSSADALFLSRVGSRHLGTAFALSSAISMAVLWGVGGLADRRDRGRLLWLGSWIALAVIVGLSLAVEVLPAFGATALLVAGKQVGGSLELLLWVVIADRFTAREARRLLPWVIVAHGAGGAAGAFAVGPLASAFGAIAPLWFAAILLFFVSGSARLLMRAPDHRIGQIGAKRARVALSGLAVFKERPLARWLGLLVASAGIFAPMMYYLLGVSAAAEHPSEVELAGFLGNYRAYVQGGALLAQVAIAPWLSQRLGVGMMMLLAPLGALCAALWVGLQDALLAVLLAQGLTRILDTAIQNPAEQLIQNLLPQDVRGRVAGLVGGLAKRSGAVIGGLLASLLIVWPSFFSAALACAAGLWLLIATLLWKRFADLAVGELSSASSSTQMAVSDDALRVANQRGLQQLRARLRSTETRQQRSAIALLARLSALGKADVLDELIGAIESSPADARLEQAIMASLGDGAQVSRSARARVGEMLSDQVHRNRELGWTLLSCASGESEHKAALLRALEGREELAARMARTRLQGGSVLEELVGEGHSAEVVHQLRIEIARAARGDSRDRQLDLAERLLRSIARCPDPEMQVAGLGSVVAAMGDPSADAMSLLLCMRLAELADRWRESEEPALREAALLALASTNSQDYRSFVLGLGDRDESVRRRAEIILRDAGDNALEALSIASQSGRRRVRLAAVDLLADLRPSEEALERLLDQELEEMARCSRHARALEALPASKLVRRRLGERVDEAVEAALMALEARSASEGIGEVARRLARAASERSRARALEALDALLPRKMARTMLGAMEGTLEVRLEVEQVVESELSGRDRLTRDLLVEALGSEGRAAHRKSIASAASAAARALDPMALVERLVGSDSDSVSVDVPSTLETIVALSELSLFADLSTVQLEELAAVVQWQAVQAGETLMSQGEEGHCMYFVRTGSLDVLVKGKAVAKLGSGEPVGELALFAEDRRTATVVAREDCQLGVLSREDIENLVEEVPGIALQLCRAMSRRLAEANR